MALRFLHPGLMLEVQAVPLPKGKNQRGCLLRFLILTQPAARIALVFLFRALFSKVSFEPLLSFFRNTAMADGGD